LYGRQQLHIELRWGAGNAERIGTFAKESVDLRPNAIFAHSTPVLRALARGIRTIPIVFAGASILPAAALSRASPILVATLNRLRE
jgi:ABC-type uncharacterized transport system substrate-binding protein